MKLANPIGRATNEWIGTAADAAIPLRVRLRVFERFNGICQCGCGVKIRVGDAWEADHRIALINGGTNSETNLVPLLAKHHKTKTAADVALKSKTTRTRMKHLGIKPKKRKMGYRLFDGTPVPSRYE